jgi:hypothetical protein
MAPSTVAFPASKDNSLIDCVNPRKFSVYELPLNSLSPLTSAMELEELAVVIVSIDAISVPML